MRTKRFKVTPSGYKFDRYLFRVLAASFVFVALLMVAVYGFDDNVYYHCPADTHGYCISPFFDEVGNCIATDRVLCDYKAFPPAFTYGNKPSWLIANFFMVFFTMIIITFLINHYKNNERWAR